MSYRKGERTPAKTERDWPHIVEMEVPVGGFGKSLDPMYAFYRERYIESRNGRGRRDDVGRFYVRWCFSRYRDCRRLRRALLAGRGSLRSGIELPAVG